MSPKFLTLFCHERQTHSCMRSIKTSLELHAVPVPRVPSSMCSWPMVYFPPGYLERLAYRSKLTPAHSGALSRKTTLLLSAVTETQLKGSNFTTRSQLSTLARTRTQHSLRLCDIQIKDSSTQYSNLAEGRIIKLLTGSRACANTCTQIYLNAHTTDVQTDKQTNTNM